MSRSGYSDNCDNWDLIRWRGAVTSAIRGKRGQSFLRELVAALDAIPTKRLIAEALECGGEVCALGSIGRQRGIAMGHIDPWGQDGDGDNSELLASMFKIPMALAKEIMFENDQDFRWSTDDETPEQRWSRMRAWAVAKIKQPTPQEAT